MDSLEQELCGIVAQISGVRRVAPDQRLYHDLGISGDDAVEVIEAIHKRFGTSFTGFRFEQFFPQESEALGEHVKRIFGFSKVWTPLTVSHLVAVADKSEWFEP